MVIMKNLQVDLYRMQMPRSHLRESDLAGPGSGPEMRCHRPTLRSPAFLGTKSKKDGSDFSPKKAL